MSGTPVAIGPFTGGLNLNEDPLYIADNELAECINFDIGRAGELTTRPGFKAIHTAINPMTNKADKPVYIAGVVSTKGVFDRLYVKQERTGPVTSPGWYSIWFSDTPESLTKPWNFVTDLNGDVKTVLHSLNPNLEGGAFDQFYTWFIPYGTASTGAAHNTNTNTVVAVSGMPRGSTAVIFKNRMFISGNTADRDSVRRVYYSAVGNYSTWPANNFFDVDAGEGGTVTALAIQGDSLIIFKQTSTWVLYYESDPFLGTLRKINNEIGATGQDSIVFYKNELYVISKRNVHRLVSLLYEDIGHNVALHKIRTAYIDTDFIAILSDKIFCGIRINNGATSPYKYYVYHTLTNTWSEYRFNGFNPNRLVTFSSADNVIHNFSTSLNSLNLYDVLTQNTAFTNYGDHPNDTTAMSFATKRYTYGDLTSFKRLFWWAVEILGNSRTFSLSAVVDDKVTGAQSFALSPDVFTILKAFVRTRFRTIQYVLRSAQENGYLKIRNGQAYIGGKKEVNSGFPSPKV